MRVIVFLVLLYSVSIAQAGKGTLKGIVTDQHSKKPLSGSNIIVLESLTGTTSDSIGNYILNLDYGKHKIKFSYTGYQSKTFDVKIDKNTGDITLNVELQDTIYTEKEVTVFGKHEDNSIIAQGLENKDIKKMPTINADVLKTIHMMPGVTSNNELSSSYNVRGGNFDENLIYLNGYEIYRPFMLRSGIEENHNIINRDLVKDIRFYNGAFSAEFGDKMSSALEINYKSEYDKGIHGMVRGNLLYSGAILSYSNPKLNIGTAFRYAYPQNFLGKLQTAGKYNPEFKDVQVLADYSLSPGTALQLFGIHAKNKYDLTPEEWKGHFIAARPGQSPLEIRSNPPSEVRLDYDDNSESIYSYNISLFALKYFHSFNQSTSMTVSSALYISEEKENIYSSGKVYFSENALGNDEPEELKSFLGINDNSIRMNSYEAKSVFRKRFSNNTLTTSLIFHFNRLNKNINEFSSEDGTESLLTSPVTNIYSNKNNFTSTAFYIQDEINFNNKLNANFGFRAFYYSYNKEFLVSPRLGIFYKPSTKHSLSFNWGYYYQPPFFYELRNKDLSTLAVLKSQKAVHYVFAWEYQFKEKVKFMASPYYKKLDRLIPYYIKQLSIEYSDKNNMEGYAYGMDLQVQGEIINGIESWISYSYLDTKERLKEPGAEYNRRLLDQTHTIQAFFQDRFTSHPNWQSHLRFSFGSGFLYNQYRVVYNETGKGLLKPSFNERYLLPFYFRVDMGLTATYKVFSTKEIILSLEMLNIFNKYNTVGYTFIQPFKDIKSTVNVAQILSKRFFNVGVELSF